MGEAHTQKNVKVNTGKMWSVEDPGRYTESTLVVGEVERMPLLE